LGFGEDDFWQVGNGLGAWDEYHAKLQQATFVSPHPVAK